MDGEFPRRVLITADTVGGVWTFAIGLESQLRTYGIKVKLASFGPTLPGYVPSDLNWSHFPSRLEWMQDPWTDIAAGEAWLRSTSDDFRPDLVHLNTLSYADAGFEAPVVQTIHSCVSSWWKSVKQSPLPPQWGRYRDHVERSLQHADLITAPTSSMLRAAAEDYDIAASESLVIHNGIDPGHFQPASPEPFILSAGRLWDEAKNLSALAGVADRLPWPVYLAGNCSLGDGQQIEFAGCRWLGELSPISLADWYARAAIYAAPAKYEPFGLSILEAACSGCALVLGDIPSLREIWLDAAIFVSSSDDLLQALTSLITNPALRDVMARRASSRAQRFTAARMTEGYLDAYKRMSACVL